MNTMKYIYQIFKTLKMFHLKHTPLPLKIIEKLLLKHKKHNRKKTQKKVSLKSKQVLLKDKTLVKVSK